MTARRRTLTTIGLSIRDEMRVKSLLQIVEGKTAAPWMYVEEAQADLALCEPDSALASVIVKQAARVGSPRCVMLLRQNAPCPPATACVFAPLGVRELIALLDGATETHFEEEGARVDPSRHAAEPPSPTLLDHVRRVAAGVDGRTHHITVGPTRLLIVPKQNVALSNDALTPEHIAALAPRRDFEVEVLASAATEIAQSHVHRCSLPVLLWNCAIAGDVAGESWLPRNASFSLKRWPDFGRFAHRPWHLRLTSLMVREAFSTQQMSILIEQPPTQVEAFLHACDSIGLLVTNTSSEYGRTDSVKSPPAPDAEKPGRWFSIFQSFRQALNMGSGRG